jgi:enoyl-CoA hydratase/carnithine racemase
METDPFTGISKLASFHTIRFSNLDGILHLELNQPPSNTMTLPFFIEFARAVDQVSIMKGIRGLIITGRGRHFSSGADLSSLLNHISDHAILNPDSSLKKIPDFLLDNYQTLMQLEQFPFPVIAMIRGVCLGSALELALFCHFRFCSGDAVFAMPECSFNLVPGLGGIYKMSEFLGKAKILELSLRGNTFTADEAYQMHMIDKILPKRTALETVIEFIATISPDFRKEKHSLYVKKYFSS